MTKRSLYLLSVACLLTVAIVLSACRPRVPQGESAGACAAPELGLYANADNVVVRLGAGGAADTAGVQVGDRLIALEGVPFALGQQAIRVVTNRVETPCRDVYSPDEDRMLTATAAVSTPQPTIDTWVRLVIERKGVELVLDLDLSLVPRYVVMTASAALDSPLTPTPLPFLPGWMVY